MRVAAVILVAALLLVAVLVMKGRGGDDAQQAPAADVTNVYVISEPPGATISAADGKPLGTTPTTLTLPRGPGEATVILRHPGYEDRRVTVPVFSQTGRIDVTLVRRDGSAAD